MTRIQALWSQFVDLDIIEHFKQADAELLRSLLLAIMRPGMRCAEIGSWKGCSTAVIADTIKPYGGTIYAIDTFRGNETTWNVGESQTKELVGLHRYNMRALGFEDTVVTVVARSQCAAAMFPQEFFDLVFIDGDHRYEPFLADLRGFWPLVRDGGIICGHDYDIALGYADLDDTTRATIDGNLTIDFVSGLGHPGVIKGCHDAFPTGVMLGAREYPGSVMWWKAKGTDSVE